MTALVGDRHDHQDHEPELHHSGGLTPVLAAVMSVPREDVRGAALRAV